MSDLPPPQAYRPVYAAPKISKLVAKIGFKVRAAGPHQFVKASGGKAHAKPGGKAGGKSGGGSRGVGGKR